MTEKLTEKQKKVHEFIENFAKQHGFAPSFREIAKAFKVNVGAIQKHVKALISKGHIEHAPKLSRGMNVSGRANMVKIPLLGSVPAGMPALAIDNFTDEYIHVDEVVVKGGKSFALRVQGDSMTGAGIQEGDTVVVRQQPGAEHGDIVVAMIDGEATVKKLIRQNGETYLMPMNPKYRPIRADHIEISGKVVFLMRNV